MIDNRTSEGMNSALTKAHTSMGIVEAQAIAAKLYALHGPRATRLAAEKDDTFRITVAEGMQYVLKVAHPADDPDVIDFECSLMGHVHQRDPSFPIPQHYLSVDGLRSPVVEDQAGQRRLVRLISLLPGTTLDRSTTTSAKERACVGEALARLRLATTDFRHPADTRPVAWDVRHLSNFSPFISSVADRHQRANIDAAMNRLAGLQSTIQSLRTQVLHNDFSKSNILVDHVDPQFVTGIIDFGDAVNTAIAVDLSTALLNQLPRDLADRSSDDIFADGRDLLSGYLTICDLTTDELAMLPHLVMARVVARTAITTWRAEQFPQNRDYVLRNTQQGSAQLGWFLARHPEQLSTTFLTTP